MLVFFGIFQTVFMMIKTRCMGPQYISLLLLMKYVRVFSINFWHIKCNVFFCSTEIEQKYDGIFEEEEEKNAT